MVTHNMKDAIQIGNRLINDALEGRVIYDVKGEEKKKLQIEDLLHKFEEVRWRRICKRQNDACKIKFLYIKNRKR